MQEAVYIKEANSEVLVVIHKHCNTRLETLEEAAKVIQREVLRLQTEPTPRYDRFLSQ